VVVLIILDGNIVRSCEHNSS